MKAEHLAKRLEQYRRQRKFEILLADNDHVSVLDVKTSRRFCDYFGGRVPDKRMVELTERFLRSIESKFDNDPEFAALTYADGGNSGPKSVSSGPLFRRR